MMTTTRWITIGILATLLIMGSIPLYMWRIGSQPTIQMTTLSDALPSFAGSQKCAECHKAQYDNWKGSHIGNSTPESPEKPL